MRCYIRAAVLVALAVGPARAQQDCRVSSLVYERLTTGMTYEEVVRVVGCEGSQVSDTEIAGAHRFTYVWSAGEATNTNHINAIFENGKLIRKDQSGLE